MNCPSNLIKTSGFRSNSSFAYQDEGFYAVECRSLRNVNVRKLAASSACLENTVLDKRGLKTAFN